MPQIIENLSKQPLACIILSVIIFLFGFLMNYLLLDSLLKMHRSKSAVKKLKKEYTFLQKMQLIHFKENCRHAIKFCKIMIVYQKISWVCLALYLIISLLFAFGLFSVNLIAWLTVGIFVIFDVPAFIINRLFARPILFGRFKEFSFEKYHNTENHDNLL